ncbi:uncharacterized protein LOC113360534 [Papaver somniferum]|uniref:uncharacterized protein LOC113360534 n=1 Tax=Papaver somniferum TaxID=3469 RepID=UPI000E705C1D|nr:uncharacterized protein LOC113360534 [Papaver somniferum]
MPVGLTNALSTFQDLMNDIFQAHLRKFILVFFDDILIYSSSLEEHIHHLKIILSLLRQHQLFAKLSKCYFSQPEIEFLGHIINADGVKVDPSKIRSMTEWPLPSNIKELIGFLGLTGYYRKFVQGYGILSRPLTELLKKNAFTWSHATTTAFHNLKIAMTQTPVLAFPDLTKDSVLEADACENGIGAVLMQQGRPIAFFSQPLGPRATTLSTYEKEMLLISQVVTRWRHYLQGHHSSFGQITKAYKKGSKNKVDDVLLRRPHPSVECLSITVTTPLLAREIVASYEGFKMSPFKDLYGYEPPYLAFPSTVITSVASVEEYLKQRYEVLNLLRENLHKAQEIMKLYDDTKRVDRSFDVGDMVYLKLHPYRHSSIALRKNVKLSATYYGPFPVLQKIGVVAYKLQLPLISRIHPVFHVSQLKKKIGTTHTPSPSLPVVDYEGQIILHPAVILDSRTVARGRCQVDQLIIQWKNASAENSTWEDYANVHAHFPNFNP